MGYLKSTGTVFIYIGLFLALVAFLPGIPPDAQFSEYSILSPPLALTGNLGQNKRLVDAEILFEGELKGPESFASYNGELYTSLHGGDIVKIVGKHIVPIVKFGKPCEGLWMEKECGRPLGLQFDKNGALYVVDAYYGIFKVDVTSGKYQKIVDISKPIEGVVPKLANGLDIASNGDVYWSDSSSDYLLQDGVYTSLANPSGRLIRYDAATKRNVVLVGNLGFANGVKLSKDESFVVVVETFSSRLTKFHLKGSKAGKAEPFVQGLPGLPDNIHTDGDDGFLVSLVMTADADHPVLMYTLAPHPHIRRLLSRLLYLLEAPFKLLEDVYPNIYSKRATHWIGHFESISALYPAGTIVLRIDASGNIIDAAYNSEGKISSISSAFIFKDHVYLGSPYNEYIARVPLKQAFPSIKPVPQNIVPEKVVVKREAKEPPKPVAASTPAPQPTTTTPPPPTMTPKPVTTPPRPVTTTPKPVTTAPKPTQAPVKQQETAKPAPASPPPPPAQKAPVREASPAREASPPPPPKPAATTQAPQKVEPTKDTTTKPAGKPSNTQVPPPSPSNAQKTASPPTNTQKSPPLPPTNTQKSPPPPPTNTQKSPPPPPTNTQKSSPPPPSNAQKTTPPPSASNTQKPAESVVVKNAKVPEPKKTEQPKETAKPPVASPPPSRN